MAELFNLAIVVDDDPDIALAARLALRDMFERVEALSARGPTAARVSIISARSWRRIPMQPS